MEGTNAVELFQRALDHNMKYIYFVSDGDVKYYHKLRYIYDNDPANIVHKLECWNHLSKNMVEALEKQAGLLRKPTTMPGMESDAAPPQPPPCRPRTKQS